MPISDSYTVDLTYHWQAGTISVRLGPIPLAALCPAAPPRLLQGIFALSRLVEVRERPLLVVGNVHLRSCARRIAGRLIVHVLAISRGVAAFALGQY